MHETDKENVQENGYIDNDDFPSPIFMPVTETIADTAPQQQAYCEWEEIIPLSSGGSGNDGKELPKIDPICIPPFLRDYALECAKFYQTAFEMPLFCALACLATAVQGKFEVEVKKGYVEPLNLYILITAEPSEFKSPTLKALKAPLEKWEQEKNAEEKEKINIIISERKTLEKVIEAKRAKASKVTDIVLLQELSEEIIELEKDLADIPHYTRLFADDVTPESLGEILERQQGKLTIAEAEGGFFSILAGRYSKGVPNLDLILKAYNGENVRIDRKGFKPIFIENPCLTLLFLIQPYLLKNRENSEAFKGRGLDARFLYVLPSSKVGYRSFDNEPINKVFAHQYHNSITHFLNMPLVSDEPYKLSMTTEAYTLYAVFMNTLEEAMREGNELENMRDWAGKKGTLARIVGLLHCATYPMPQHEQIQANTVQNACAVMSCLIEHAKHAYGLMSDTEEVQTAKKILMWLNNTRKQSFSARDCYQAIRGRVKKQEEANIALNLLEEHSYIRKIPLEKGIGRPSIKYEVNPNFGRC